MLARSRTLNARTPTGILYLVLLHTNPWFDPLRADPDSGAFTIASNSAD